LTLQWGKNQISTHRAETMTLSLLMELGKVVASITLEEEGKRDAFRAEISAAKTLEEIAETEKRFLDITSEWIAALMFKHWKFHESMVSMMRFVHTPEDAPEQLRRQSAYERADRYGLQTQTLHEAIEKIGR